MSELLKLAERCERAAGPDRQLDLDITNAITTKAGWFWCDDLHQTISRNDYGRGAVGNPICSLDPYTSFVDHAITLVPENAEWECGTALLISAAWASVIHIDGRWQAKAKTPALALCAAALRARDALRRAGDRA